MSAPDPLIPGLSFEEIEVLEHLVAAWDAFVKLPHEHNDDAVEFRHGIHALQAQIMARPTRRFIKGLGR